MSTKSVFISFDYDKRQRPSSGIRPKSPDFAEDVQTPIFGLPLTIDLDSTICETDGLAKEGACHHGYTGGASRKVVLNY